MSSVNTAAVQGVIEKAPPADRASDPAPGPTLYGAALPDPDA
jgi:hypothetical protein